jgi:hypothetical protein
MYPAALVMALLPLLGGIVRAWPPAGDGWRFMVVSVMVDTGPTLLAGLVLALLAALLLDDRKVVKRLGLSTLVVGVIELLLVGFLVVDLLLTQSTVGPGTGNPGVTSRMVETVLFALALVGLGLGTRKVVTRLPERDPGGRRTSDRISL